MSALRLSPRRTLLTALALGSALGVTACGGGTDPAPQPSEAASTPSASSVSSAPTKSAPTTPSGASTSSTTTPAVAPSSEPAPEPSSPATSAALEECSGLTGPEALQQAVDEGLATPYPDVALENADYSAYDDCAELSAVVLTLGNGGLPGMEVQLFHRGDPVGAAPDAGLSTVITPLTRIDAATLQAVFPYARPGESHAEASGRATSTYTWDADTETVVRSGDLPPTRADASSPTASTPASSPAAGGEAASPGVLAHGDDKGFCFFGPESITCFGKHGNSATLNATGPAELRRDLPATGWEELPEPTTLAPGQSATLGGFECEATAAGFTCVSTTSGAGFTVEGPEMSTIPPTG